MNCPNRACRNQRGNVLFIILIAVVLFAALSYAVTQSTRTGEDGGKRETAKTQAAEIMNYAVLVRSEVQRLLIMGELQWNQIDFSNQFTRRQNGSGGGNPVPSNPNCTASLNTRSPCRIFSDSGGRVYSRAFYEMSSKWQHTSGNPYPGDALFSSQFIENVGTNEPELLMIVTDLSDEICNSINESLGLPHADNTPTYNLGWGWGLGRWGSNGVAGLYHIANTSYDDRLPGPASAFIGQEMFCINMLGAGPGPSFVFTLLAR